MKKVTIIIPNYNGLHFLKTCLQAVEAQRYQDFETLIIDNASTDGSVEYVRKHFPGMRVEVMPRNLGFSGGVNVGIKLAKTPYVLLLNNDTRVHPSFTGELVKAIEASKDIFSVCSKMIQYYKRDLLDDAGDMYCVLGWQFQRGTGHPVTGYRRPCDIFSGCAAGTIYRRHIFQEIGYFDELHFAYLEDVDVGYRAKLYGYRNRYCPTAIVYHVGSGTSGSKYNSFKVKLTARNSVYLNYKNMPSSQLILNAIPLAVGYLLKWRFYKGIGFGNDYLDGLKEGFATRKRCKRVSFDKNRAVCFAKVEWELIRNTFIYTFEFLKRRL